MKSNATYFVICEICLEGIRRLTYLTILDNKTIVNTRLQHFQHLVVLHIVTDMFKDISVRNNTECTENDPNRNIDLDVWDSGLHDISSLMHKN